MSEVTIGSGVSTVNAETWRFVPGSDEFYSASTLGRIRSEPVLGTSGKQRGNLVKGNINRKGYLWFRICVPGKDPVRMTFHRAIALTFLGDPPDGYQVNHKDGNKKNNRPDNLEYVTCVENIRHCWANGLHDAKHCTGETNNKAKLTESDVIAIRSRYPGESLAQLAEKFRVTKQAVWHIVKRKTWRHV